MRIFAFVFGSLFAILLAGAASYYAHDFAIERIAAYQFNRDVTELQLLPQKLSSSGSCRSASGVTTMMYGYQLRFIDAVNYVIEAVCMDSDAESAPIKKGSLFGGVKRLYGSGIQVPMKPNAAVNGWVHFQFKNDIWVMGIFENQVMTKWENYPAETGGENAAVGLCSNWGFSCCASAKMGSGTWVPARDCAKTCFQHCVQRPQLYFFNTNPLMDSSSRTLTLYGSSHDVLFGYQIVDDAHLVSNVIVDYGDGTKRKTQELKLATMKHTYRCRQKQCIYQAKISIEDSAGIGLEENNNVIKIVINQ